MASFNTVATLRRILKIPSGDDSFTDTELQAYLDEAQLDLYSQIGREYETENFIIDYNKWGAVQTTFSFAFAPVVSIFRVTANGTTISSSTYTLDNDINQVTFDDNTLELGQETVIYYVPQIYHSAELYLAAFNVLASTQLLNTDGTTNPIAERYEKTANRYIKKIKSKITMHTFS